MNKVCHSFLYRQLSGLIVIFYCDRDSYSKDAEMQKKAITIYRFHGKANRIGENWQVAKLQRHKYKQRGEKNASATKAQFFRSSKAVCLVSNLLTHCLFMAYTIQYSFF